MSKFNEIFLDLEAAILNQRFISGDLLPSENELVKTYNVSRETIRKALNLLLEKGYIQKMQGKGSVVLDIKRFDFPVSGLTSYKELQDAQNMNSQTIVVHNGLQSTTEDLANHLKLAVGTSVLYLERLRKVHGAVVSTEKDYLLTSFVPSISNEAAEDSLYHYIEQTLGLSIGYAQKEITVDPITEEDKRLMDLQEDTHVVVVRSDVYLEDTTLFQHTESRHRLDRFRFVDFARRRNSL